MPEKEFDKYASTYSAEIDASLGKFGTDHDFFVRHKAAVLGERFTALGAGGEGPKVLDVGCGVGLVHAHLAPKVRELHGVEVSEASLEEARARNPGVVYQAYNGDILPYADGEFDAAYAINVMHHVPVESWPAFARELARVVRPGGLVIIIEHNPLNPATQWIVRTCPLDENAVLVAPWKLAALMRAAGVAERKIEFVLTTPFEAPVFRAIDRVLGWAPLGAQYVMTGRVGASTPVAASG